MKKFLLLFYFIFGYTIAASSAANNYNAPPTVVTPTFSGPSGTVNSSPVTVTLTLDRPVSTPLKLTDFTVDNGSIATLSEKVTLTYSSQFGTAGSGNSMLNKPNDVAVNAAGQTFVSDGLNNRIEIFNADGSYANQFGTVGTGNTQFNQPYGIALDASGNIYVADMGNNRIQVYNSTFNYIKTIGAGDLSSPKGIYIDASNNLYVADYGNNRVAIFDNTGTFNRQIKNAGAGAGQFLSPAGVTLDAAGAVYITDSENGQVVKFGSAGNYISKIVGSGSGSLSAPSGITIDGTGKIYVVDNANQFIEVFSAAGSAIGIIAGSGSANGTFNFPEGITTDKSGNIYVADQINNRVQVLKVKEQYTLSVVPAANGMVTINLPANIVHDVNGYENIAATFSFNYIATPSTPSGLTAISLDKNVELDWQANPANENIFSYKIYVRTATDAISLVATVPGSVTTYTAHTPLLVNGTTYYYSIVAVNNSGVVSNYSPEVAVVPMASQTITAGTIPDKTYGDPPFSIAGIATASSGLPVTYAVASGPASILADGVTVKITGAGVVHINVNQVGNTTINPAPTYDLQFTVNQATPIITWAKPADIFYGTAIGATQLNAQANVPGTYVYDPTLLSATKYDVGPHTLSVLFTPTDIVDYKTATASVIINVKPIDPVISWTVPQTILAKTDVTTLENATISSPVSIAGNWSYSIPAGTILHTGNTQSLTATFTPIAPDNVNYNQVSKTVTFNVVPITPAITWATPADITYGTALSSTQLNATISGGIGGVWTYNPLAGKILQAGQHQQLNVDFAPTDADYAHASQTVYINVNIATPQIVWAMPAPITYGTALSSTQLNATTVGNVAGTMTYTPALGSILNAGTQTLTAHFIASDPNYDPTEVTATVSIVVGKATPVITWANPADINYGTLLSSVQLNAKATQAITNTPITGTFAYSPGLNALLPLGPNTLNVIFHPTGADANNYLDNTPGSATIVVKAADPVINWTVPTTVLAKTDVSTLENATISPSGIAGNWTYSIAAGTILHVGNNQTLTATFTPIAPDDHNYNIVSKTVTFNVVPITPVITWATPADITYGTALSNTQLDASVSSTIPGALTYDHHVGQILPLGPGQPLIAYFTPTDADYAAASKTVYINVTQGIPQIVWATPADITYGTVLSDIQLNATTVGNVAGTMTYTPAAGTKLDVGTVHTLTAHFVATDPNYSSNEVTATVNLVVKQATPVITWATPANIPYGTAITATQLNAQANVPGTYVYDPTLLSATKYNVGPHTLSVIFTPTDQVNYTTATASVTINVKKADPVINWNVPATILAKTDVSTLENATISNPVSIAGNWTYSNTPAGNILHPGTNETITATFTPTSPDDASYNIVTKTVTFNVVAITPVITWATPADITYGTALSNTQLNATISGGIDGVWTYNPAIGKVLQAGTHQLLTVNFVPTDPEYATANQTVYINVKQATPQITWATPAPITYGTVLSDTQLNATTVGNVAGNMTYSPAAGTLLGVGAVHALTAYFVATDPNYSSAQVSATVNLVVNKAIPVITWPNPADITYGTLLSDVQLNATATQQGTGIAITGDFVYSPAAGSTPPLSVGSNTLHVIFHPTGADANNYSDNTPGSATIVVKAAYPVINWTVPATVLAKTDVTTLENGTISPSGITGNWTYGNTPTGNILHPGTSQTITATFTPAGADVNNYNTVSKTITFNVVQITPVITWATPADITYGTLLSNTQLNASVNGGIDGAPTYDQHVGQLLPLGTHQALTFNFVPTDPDYATVSKTVYINVTQATPQIVWATPADITYGTLLSNAQLNATTVGNVAGTMTYSPAAGAKLAVGNQVLTAYFVASDPNYSSARVSGNVNINVNQVIPVITWPDPANITYGTPLSNVQLNAKATIPNTNTTITGRFIYSPAADGTVLSIGSHTLNVVFHPTDAVNYKDNVPQTATIIVGKADPVINWTPTPVAVNTILGIAQLNATTVGNIAGTFDYGSLVGSSYSTPGNKSVTVTFHPTDLTKYNDGVTLTTTLNVYVVSTTNINPQINWTTPADITYGTAIGSDQYNATATLPNSSTQVDGTFTYTSTSPDAIPHVGTYTLTAIFTPTDATHYNTATKTVQLKVKPAGAPLIWNTPNPVPLGTVLGDVQLDASSTLAGTYVYSPLAGTALNIAGNQNLSVTFTPTNTDYSPATKGVTIVVYAVDVAKITPPLIWNTPAAINYGTALSVAQLNAKTVDPAILGTFAYSNPEGTKLPVGANAVGVTFIPNDNVHYNSAQASVTITVNPVQSQVTWAKPAPIVYGTALSTTQLNAQANLPGIISYSEPLEAILNAGDHTLLASFVPTDNNYLVGGASVVITVNKETPTITWPAPNGISQGVALSDVQLNATANVPGTFNYSPGLGKILDAGINQLLTVTFTPTDGANYNTKTQTVKINVGKLTPDLTWAAPTAITYGTALGDTQLYATSSIPGTYTYLPAAGTVLHAGNGQRLTVTFTPKDAVNYNSKTIYTTINVNKATVIVAANSVTRAYNQPDPTFSVSYTGLVNGETPDNFLTPVTISTTTSVTSLVGTYPITVSGATSNDYIFRFVNGTLTITSIGRDLTFDKLPVKTYGDPDFDASASSTSGEPITYTSSNPSVATVVDGLIHIVGAGYVTITASLPVNPDYNTTPVVSQFMIVNKASQNIDFANIPVQLRGTTYDLSNVKSNSGLSVTFTSNDPMIASINGLTISSLRIGITGIVANQAGDANYYAANTVVRQLEVTDPTREVIVHPAVSPNGDGINEYLYIEGINEHPDNRVTIINRNGVRVYEITGYDNATKSFDGRSNFTGARQQAGTYFYLVEYVVNGVGRHLTGYFVLKYD
jgi:gliding motility-associated-like protein